MSFEERLSELSGTVEEVLDRVRQLRFDYVRTMVSGRNLDSYDKRFEQRLSQVERALHKAARILCDFEALDGDPGVDGVS